MKLRQIEHVTHKIVDRLYWNEFCFRVWVESKLIPRYSGGNRYLNRSISGQIKKAISKCLPGDKSLYRQSDVGLGQMVYFKTAQDVNAFLDLALANNFIVREIEHPRDNAHVEFMQQNPGVFTRETLWLGKWDWRVKMTTDTISSRNNLKKWIQGFFDTDEFDVRFKFIQTGDSSIIYLTDEDDALMVKLAHSTIVRKIEHAVLLTSINLNNNNNKEGPDEPRTLQETS